MQVKYVVRVLSLYFKVSKVDYSIWMTFLKLRNSVEKDPTRPDSLRVDAFYI